MTTVNTGVVTTIVSEESPQNYERTSTWTAFYGTLLGRITDRREVLVDANNPNGDKVVYLSIVYDVPHKQQDGSYKYEGEWVDVTVPASMARRLGDYLIKGKFVSVTGNIRLGSFLGKVKDPNGITCPKCAEAGRSTRLGVEMKVKKKKIEIFANDIRLLPMAHKVETADSSQLGVTGVVVLDGEPGIPADGVISTCQAPVQSGSTPSPVPVAGMPVVGDDIPF